MKASQAAKRVGISHVQLLEAINLGKLRATDIGKGTINAFWDIKEEDLVDYIQRRAIKTAAQTAMLLKPLNSVSSRTPIPKKPRPESLPGKNMKSSKSSRTSNSNEDADKLALAQAMEAYKKIMEGGQ